MSYIYECPACGHRPDGEQKKQSWIFTCKSSCPSPIVVCATVKVEAIQAWNNQVCEISSRRRFIRKSEKDRRFTRGDDFAGDAWLDLATGNIVYTAVGVDRNRCHG